MKVWIFPIESQPMRYSDQWLTMLTRELQINGIPYQIVNGNYWQHKLKQGNVFDHFATNHWKLTQIDNFIKLWRDGEVESGDKIFDMDIWHNGLEAIAYINAEQKLNLDIYGILHAGTFDKTDFTYLSGMEYFGKHVELAWLSMAKKVFVGSSYMQQMVSRERQIYNVYNTGLPLDYEGLQQYKQDKKEDIVVWTARLAPEKDYEGFKIIREQLEKLMPYLKVIATQELNLKKEDYYKLLGKAKIVLSTARQENFGIGVLEGMACGCTPIVPNGLSYTDYVPADMRFDDYGDAISLIQHFIMQPYDVSHKTRTYSKSFYRMLQHMELVA